MEDAMHCEDKFLIKYLLMAPPLDYVLQLGLLSLSQLFDKKSEATALPFQC